MYTYYFNPFATHFPNGLDVSQLINEIEASIVITKDLITVKSINNEVQIVFNEEFDAIEEVNDLLAIIAAHIPAPHLGNQVFAINLNETGISDTIFINIAKLNVSSNIINNITHIKLLANIDDDNYNYTIRLYDTTNNNNLGEVTCNNLIEHLCDVTPLSNLPSDNFILEVHVKVSDAAAEASVFSVYMYYD